MGQWTTSTTTSGFAIQARKNGMLHPLHSKPPTNLENIREQYARPRESASPPESEYRRYTSNVGKAPNEATVVFEVGAHMLKPCDDDGYHRVFNQQFTGFPKDVGLNNGLSAPQPDFIEGLEMQEYDPFPVDERVDGAVVYKDNPFSLTLPHLAGEWKGRGKDMEKAMLHSRYDGAALVYARNQALSYLGKPDPSGHSKVTTFTTDGTNLNFYAHCAAYEDGTLKYHQYHYASANTKDTYQGYKEGRRGLRNAQDYAREQSYDLRNQLKGHWKQRAGNHPIAEAAALSALDDMLEKVNAGQENADYGLYAMAEGVPEPALDGVCDEANEDEAQTGGNPHPVGEGPPLPIPDGISKETSAGENVGCGIVEQPCQPTPAASSKSSKASCSKSEKDCSSRSGRRKRKASSPSHEPSRNRNKAKDYWVLDDESGQYFHKHSDGQSLGWRILMEIEGICPGL